MLLMEQGFGVEEELGRSRLRLSEVEEGPWRPRMSLCWKLEMLRPGSTTASASEARSGVVKWGEAGGDWERSSVSSSEHWMSWGVVRESSTVLDGD